MSKYALLLMSAFAVTAPAAFAEGASEELNLPPVGDVQNFLPVLAPAVGLGALALASAGGNSSTSTTNTTSTTSTN